MAAGRNATATGFPLPRTASRTPRASGTESRYAGAMFSAMAASYSSKTADNVRRYPSSVPSTVRSMGLLIPQYGGRKVARRSLRPGDGSATFSPTSSARSAVITPGPPELVTMTTRRPRTGGSPVYPRQKSSSSSREWTRMAPHWRSAAS